MGNSWSHVYSVITDYRIFKYTERTLYNIMIIGKKPNHSDHDQALTTLLETARRCNVRLNYEKLQYKKEEVDVLVRPTPQLVSSLIKGPTRRRRVFKTYSHAIIYMS